MLITLLISSAFALPQFPFEIQGELDAECTPQCVLCHASAAGGMGTVNRSFGLAMIDRGLVGEGPDTSASLIAALAAVAADGLDQDADGVADIDELTVGDDPNELDATFCPLPDPPPEPEYGCFSHAPVPGGLAGLAIAAAAALAARKR